MSRVRQSHHNGPSIPRRSRFAFAADVLKKLRNLRPRPCLLRDPKLAFATAQIIGRFSHLEIVSKPFLLTIQGHDLVLCHHSSPHLAGRKGSFLVKFGHQKEWETQHVCSPSQCRASASTVRVSWQVRRVGRCSLAMSCEAMVTFESDLFGEATNCKWTWNVRPDFAVRPDHALFRIQMFPQAAARATGSLEENKSLIAALMNACM